MRSIAFGAILAFLPALSTQPAQAANGPVRDLITCRQVAETAPAEALILVKDWLDHGGTDDARLCQALAYFSAGDFAAAGQAFENLATIGDGKNAGQLANLFNRAAWGWLRAGDTKRADRLYTRALERTPDDGDIRLDRGIARTEAKRYRDAIEDFTEVLKRHPRRADAYFYRAVAWRALEDLRNALADVEQALRLKPNDAESQILRGTIRALGGDSTGARLDWREVAARDPGSPAAKAAAANLARLERVDNSRPAKKTIP
ncbi:MAG: tetratricopeptide repeat protein [Rhodospirillaceae bacterium]